MIEEHVAALLGEERAAPLQEQLPDVGQSVFLLRVVFEIYSSKMLCITAEWVLEGTLKHRLLDYAVGNEAWELWQVDVEGSVDVYGAFTDGFYT